MRSNYNAMCVRLAKRAGKPTTSLNGKVWSEEIEAYLTVEEAIASGHGKKKRSKKELSEFNELLLHHANEKAGHAIRTRDTTTMDRQEKLNFLINQQEEMAKVMNMIKQAKKAQKDLQDRLDRAKLICYIPRPQFMAIVKAKGDWKDRESLLWSGWKYLQVRTCEYAKANYLWADFFKMAAYSPTIWSSGEGRECTDQEAFTRTAEENNTIGIYLDSHLKEWANLLVK